MRKQFFALFALAFCLPTIAQTIDTDLFSPKGVAIMRITLDDGKGFWDVSSDYKLLATLTMENSSTSVYEDYEFYEGKIEIKWRGFSSQGTDQKSYNFNLVNEMREDNPHNLLGMPAHEDWALVAAHPDKSRLRIPLAYRLGELINPEWSPRTRFTELYVNNEYQGLYALVERVKRGVSRIDIKKLDSESSAADISGGYILELIPNVQERIEKEEYVFQLDYKHWNDENAKLIFTTKYPQYHNISQEQITWIKNYLNEFESVLYNDKLYKDPTNGWRKYIDENTIIDWYLINELARNCDAQMYASVFLYKERNGKLKMGPLWDFDIAFGNINYNNAYVIDGLYMIKGKWFHRFAKDEEFTQKVRARYDEIKPVFDRIPEIIRKNADILIASGAIERNFQKWNILGTYVWPNYSPYPTTYEGELQRLTDWIRARNSWLNVNMFLTQEESCAKLQTEKIPLFAYDVDKFRAEQPTTLYAVSGYDKYIWNDGAETSSSHKSITGGNTYYVKVKKEDCWSVVSDTIQYGKPETGLPAIVSADSTGIIGYYNILGEKLPEEPEKGFYIILYSNGKSQKVIK